MVALPTPAFAATASMDSASALMPPLSRASTASMIAVSAWALRGRPGALRSWSACVMWSIVTGISLGGHKAHALLLGQTLGHGGLGGGRRALAGQPDRGHQRTEEGEDGAADRGVVDRADEGVVRRLQQRAGGRAGLLGHAVRPGD